jgi:hypothetical protein
MIFSCFVLLYFVLREPTTAIQGHGVLAATATVIVVVDVNGVSATDHTERLVAERESARTSHWAAVVIATTSAADDAERIDQWPTTRGALVAAAT